MSPAPTPSGSHGDYVPLLIVDPDPIFVKAVRSDPKSKTIIPFITEKGAEAQKIISNKKQPLSALFISPEVDEPHWLTVVKWCHQTRPGIPIFLMTGDAPIAMSEVDQRRVGIHQILKKPISYSDMVKKFVPPRLLFDAAETLKKSATFDETVGTRVVDEDSNFFPISAKEFVSGSTSLFDVYVRINEGHYVKILKSGDGFTPDRIKGFLEKGVEHFFIQKEVREEYLAYCDKLLNAMMTSQRISEPVKVSQTLSYGESTLNFLKTVHKLEAAELQFAQSYVSKLWKLVDDMNLKKQSAIMGHFLSVQNLCDHATAVTMLSAILARQLGFETERSIKTIGLASLLHDVALYSAPVELQNEDEARIPDSLLQKFHHHPAQGAEYLSHINGIDPVVCQAVRQHHLKRDGSGFPKSRGSVSISLPGEIVGITDSYLRHMRKNIEESTFLSAARLDLSVLNGYLPKVVLKLKTILNCEDTGSASA